MHGFLEKRYCIVLHCIVLYCIVLYCIVLYCIVLYCYILYCIVSFWIVLYHIVLLCIPVFYCVVPYRAVVLIWCTVVKKSIVWYFVLCGVVWRYAFYDLPYFVFIAVRHYKFVALISPALTSFPFLPNHSSLSIFLFHDGHLLIMLISWLSNLISPYALFSNNFPQRTYFCWWCFLFWFVEILSTGRGWCWRIYMDM